MNYLLNARQVIIPSGITFLKMMNNENELGHGLAIYTSVQIVS